MTKKEQLVKIQNALLEMNRTWANCASAFSEVDEGLLNEVIVDKYPFELSFDEQALQVFAWTSKAIQNCKNIEGE